MLIQINSFLIFNTVLVLGINVPGDTRNDSDICMDKTLLNSCTKTCGESQCDMDSFCGEDKRCIYCYDAICKSMPIKSGCEISCAKRFTGMFEVGLQYVNFLSFSCSHQVLLIIGSKRWLNMHLIHQFCVFCKKILFLTIKLVVYTCSYHESIFFSNVLRIWNIFFRQGLL